MALKTISKKSVLSAIQEGPCRYAELAGTMSDPRRARLRRAVDALVQQGAIKMVYIDRFPYYVLSDWAPSDDQRLEIVMGRCRPVDGCMVWTGYVDKRRGPIVRFGDGSPMPVRRAIWQMKRGPLGFQQTVRVHADCEPNCVEYRHMRLGRREDKAKSKELPLLHRQRIARSNQASNGKLDWDKVREIRASSDSDSVQAQRYGVSKATIGQVRRGDTWREFGGMFTALLRAVA